jgi:hypothetical protein
MFEFITLSFYYWIITFSIVGYGILFNQYFLKSHDKDIGFIGIYGIFILIFISYLSSFFLSHTEIFNSILLVIGFVNFCFNWSNIIIQKNIKKLLIIFLILMIFIFVSKNHDDFPAYHFPYTHLLTEFSNMIGLGNFVHGFRTHSSIFYLSSLFNLPFSNYSLFHLSPVYFMGFSNIILYNKIKDQLKNGSSSYLLYLSLFSLIFINIFFYRLAEHGTDRSAMILIIVTIVELFFLTNKKKDTNKYLFLKFLVLITLIISLKTFYILYGLLLLPLILYFLSRNISITFFFKNIVMYLCLFVLVALISVNFFNTGCLLYPVKVLCFENFIWSIPISEVDKMNLWYQQWAKAGANPNYRVDNPELYIQNFNWISNWIDRYFFNKVSDFLLAVVFLNLFIFLIFFSKKIKKFQRPKFLLTYIILIFLTLVWFCTLPTLRYGGYHLIALLTFIPTSIFLSKFFLERKLLKKKVYLVLLLSVIIFLGRNTSRLSNEYVLYNYNILESAYPRKVEQNFKIFQRIHNLNECYIKKKSKACSEDYLKVKLLYNKYVYYRDEK